MLLLITEPVPLVIMWLATLPIDESAEHKVIGAQSNVAICKDQRTRRHVA
jgi:hypothetical protein